MRQRFFVTANAILLILLVAMAAMGQRPQLVSVNSAGTESGNGNSRRPAVSADGRFIAFVGIASNLVPNDTNGTQQDVFLRDTQLGNTTLVSVNRTGAGSGNRGSSSPTISNDGRFVAFSSSASDLVPNDTNGNVYDVFIRDMQTGVTRLVTVNRAGSASGNDQSSNRAISADGRFVVFESVASDLVADDFNGTQDIFVRDTVAGTTTLVSVNAAGTASGNNFTSSIPTISNDGRFIAFESFASDLVANDTNSASDIFVRDLQSQTTILVSVNRTGSASANAAAGLPTMSSDGRFVVFASSATDLVANDANNAYDIFVRDLPSGVTRMVSLNRDGSAGANDGSYRPEISRNGRFVAFTSDATNLVTNDFNGTTDLFVRDLQTGVTTLIPTNSGYDPAFEPAFSADGRFIAFLSFGSRDVFVRDLQTGQTTLTSVDASGVGGGNGASSDATISADGTTVAFTSYANNLVPNDNNDNVYTTSDVFSFRANQPPANTTPTVNITTPANGATFTAPANITVSAEANDDDGISRVDFYDGGILIGTAAGSPYSVTWNTSAVGSHTLTARAIDNAGATATSSAVVISVNSNNNSLPSPWASRDIGNVGLAGRASYADGSFTIRGSGQDIWGSSDSFRYVYQPLTGDGQIVARVSSLTYTDDWAKVGVMIRETLASNSRYAMTVVTAGNGAAFQRRLNTGGGSFHTGGAGGAPLWVKLVRRSNNFSGYTSTDGANWRLIKTETISMNSAVSVGMAVTSHNNNALCRAVLDSVAVGRVSR